MNQNVNERNKPYIDNLIEAMGTDLKMVPNPCPCGAADDMQVADKDRWDIPITVKLCKCGLMRTDPYFTKQALDIIYKDYYRHIDLMYTEDEWIEWEQTCMNNLLSTVEHNMVLSGKQAFEIGCGLGAGVQVMADRGYESIGFDSNVEDAKRLYPDLRFEENWELYPGKADLITLIHSFEHMLDPIGTAKLLKSMLNPKGILAIVVPGLATINTTYQHSLQQYLVFTHPFHYTVKTLANIMHRAGLGIIMTNPHIEMYLCCYDGKKPVFDGMRDEVLTVLSANHVVHQVIQALDKVYVPMENRDYLQEYVVRGLDTSSHK